MTEAPVPAALGSTHVAEYPDGTTGKMVRVFPDGSKQEASMAPGPGGFAIASFAGEPPFETEIPNLLLPPSALAPAEHSHAAEPVVGQPPAGDVVEERALRVEWSQKTHKIAIRNVCGVRRQLFSFGKRSVSKERLTEIASDGVRQLSLGTVSEQECKEACLRQLALEP